MESISLPNNKAAVQGDNKGVPMASDILGRENRINADTYKPRARSESQEKVAERKVPKGILRPPRQRSPEDLLPVREGAAPFRDAVNGSVPPGARWTKISRKLVNPEALKAGRERFEIREDFIVVLRVLSKEEVQQYADATQKIRGAREMKEALETRRAREHGMLIRDNIVLRKELNRDSAVKGVNSDASYNEDVKGYAENLQGTFEDNNGPPGLNAMMFPSADPFAYPNQPMMEFDNPQKIRKAREIDSADKGVPPDAQRTKPPGRRVNSEVIVISEEARAGEESMEIRTRFGLESLGLSKEELQILSSRGKGDIRYKGARVSLDTPLPLDAVFTKISRKLVIPEVLRAGREHWETRGDYVIVGRVLSKEEIQRYVDATQKIRSAREKEYDDDGVDEEHSLHRWSGDESDVGNVLGAYEARWIAHDGSGRTWDIDRDSKPETAIETEDNKEREIEENRAGNNISAASRSSSIASIADSLFSTISGSSMSSTGGIQGASERLVSLLLSDDIIKPLCNTGLIILNVERFENNLRRLLKDFAVGLQKEAATIQQRHAAHFVRYQARNSAHRICNTLNQNRVRKSIEFEFELENMSEDSDSSLSNDESDNLQQLEAFIKTSKAIEILRERLREFIYPQGTNDTNTKNQMSKDLQEERSPRETVLLFVEILKEKTTFSEKSFSLKFKDTDLVEHLKFKIHEEQGIPPASQILTFNGKQLDGDHALNDYGIQTGNTIYLSVVATKSENDSAAPILKASIGQSRQAFDFCLNFLRLLAMRQRPPLADGKTRIEWRCKCGHRSYDDFTELRPGGSERLRQTLIHAADSGALRDSSTVSSTLSRGLSRLSSIFAWGSVKNSERSLPLHERHIPNNQLGSYSTNPTVPGAPVQELVYLLLCYNDGRYATRLLQLDLIQLQAKSDMALFTILRTNYNQMRGLWLAYFSLRTLLSIKFVLFEMHRSQLVDIRKEDDVPPPEHVEYRYQPAPPDVIPPVGERHMMHLFHHPSHAEDDCICLDRFPKKLKEKLQCRGGVNKGWGLHFVEGWDVKKIWVIAFVFLGLGSLLIGVLWAVYEQSVQDAFAIASYMVAFATVSVGTFQALLAM